MARSFPFLLLVVTLICSSCASHRAVRNKSAYHFQMGQTFFAENNITSALVEFSEAEKLNPNDPELLNYLGLSYYRKGKYELAEKKYLGALELKPSFSEARNNLGVNYLEMKRWNLAISQFNQVLEDIFYRGQEDAQINLGLAHLGNGTYEQALAVLRGVVAKNPHNPRARLTLGRVYFALEKTELAVTEYQKALQVNPSYANAYYNLALAELKLAHSEAARSAFREVIRIAPDSEIGQLSREYLDLLK